MASTSVSTVVELFLAAGFVDDDRSRDRRVEGLDGCLHRNHDAVVGRLYRRSGQSGPLATDENRDRPAKIRFEERMAIAGRGGDDPETLATGLINRFVDVTVDEYGLAQGAAHRPPKRFPAERIGTCARADDAARAAGFRDPHDRSDISRILYVNGNDHEGRVAVDAAACAKGAFGERDHRAGGSYGAERLHDSGGHLDDRYVFRSQSIGELGDLASSISRRGFAGHRGFAYANPGAERFGDKMYAVEQEHVGAFALRRGAKSRDDGVLAARDGGHAGRIALW